jgi:hypothetical protein
MVYVLINLKVQDFGDWKSGFDEMIWSRHDAGEADFHVYRNLADPGDVTVLLEWETIDRARRFLDHDKSKEFLQEGAVGPVQIRYLAEAVSLRRTAAD